MVRWGAIYAPFIDFVAPQSFGLIVSINVLALVIIGGMGNTTGVVAGSAILIGVPEVLQFSETSDLLANFGWLRDGVNTAISGFNSVTTLDVSKLPPANEWGRSWRSIDSLSLVRYLCLSWCYGLRDCSPAVADNSNSRASRSIRSRETPDVAAGELDVRAVGMQFEGLSALSDVSLHVPPGEIHGLIGPNGAGKTTMFNCLTGFYRPTAGEVWLSGSRIDGFAPHQISGAGVSRTFQNIRLFSNMTAIENILVASHRRIGGLPLHETPRGRPGCELCRRPCAWLSRDAASRAACAR